MDKLDEKQMDPAAYRSEYRSMLKAVLLEALAEKNAQVRQLFKEAIKEWLTEQLHDKSALAVKLFGALIIAGVAYMVLGPKK